MFAKSTIAVALFASYVAAAGTYNNDTLNATGLATVSMTTRAMWCDGQQSTCGTLCTVADSSPTDGGNTCDPTSLNYTCTCANNNSAPGLEFYTPSMPNYICQQVYTLCIINGQNVKAAQDQCTADRLANCGTIDASNLTNSQASSSSSSASAAATSTPASSTTGSSSTSSSSAAAATMMAIGREYGSGMVAAGVAAAFGLLL